MSKRQKGDEDAPDVGVDEGEQGEEDKVLSQVMEHQESLEKMAEEVSDRVLAIEQEYSKKRRPLYKQRAELLRQIPNFWAFTFARHPAIAGMFSDDDMDVMQYCTDVDVEDNDDIKTGFKIMFTFSPDNPYFSNHQLIKTFHYADDASLHIKGTTPNWMEGMEPAEEPQQVGSKRGRREYRFFLWFMDEELEAGAHDELADLIRDDIWTNPVKYYTGDGLAEVEGEQEEPEYEEVYEVEGEEEGAEGEFEGEEGQGGEEAEAEEAGSEQ